MRLSFIVESVQLSNSVLSQIKPNNMIKLNVVHKQQYIPQEYLINQPQGLYSINHDFKIATNVKNLKELLFTVRKVEKKWCLENLFMTGPKQEKSKRRISFAANYENVMADTNIQYKYEQLANSLLGFSKINIENLQKGENNRMTVDIVTKGDSKVESKVVGHANIIIYILNDEANQKIKRRHSDICSSNIIFEDPDCYVFQ